ncbi:MAG: DUF4912 domain-containing protein [Spirochaetales bacterium]|nr:DUF4912 domain-containing protein [Spirochaetales bacterium]
MKRQRGWGGYMTRERLNLFSFEELLQLASNEDIEVTEGICKESLIELILEVLSEQREERSQLNNISVRGEEIKYNIMQDEEIDLNHRDEYPIPRRYKFTRILFLPRDPFWAYAYWDFEDELIDKIKADENFERLFLRVHDIKMVDFNGKNSNYSFDIEIQLEDNSWYINIPHPDSDYILELYYSTNGQEVFLTRSNRIQTPLGRISDVIDNEWHSENTDKLIEASHHTFSQYQFSWGNIPQRILSFKNLNFLQRK